MNTIDARRTAAQIVKMTELHGQQDELDAQLRKVLDDMINVERLIVEAEFADPTCSRDVAEARLCRAISLATTRHSVPATVDPIRDQMDAIRNHMRACAALDLLGDRLRRAQLRVAAHRA